MRKAELVDAIAEKSGCTKKAAGDMLEAFTEAVTETVAAGEEVSLICFGTFKKKIRPERKGRNPQTGEDMVIPAAAVPTFKPGKAFKDLVK